MVGTAKATDAGSSATLGPTVRQRRFAACMSREHCPWGQSGITINGKTCTHASGYARASPGARSSHAPCACALSRAPSRTLARAPLLAPAARAIALQATGLRATPTRPPGVLGSLREDLSNVE